MTRWPWCAAIRAAHLADRAEAEDRDRTAVGDRRRTRPPATRSEARRRGTGTGRRRALGDLDRPELRLRHAQELGLTAGHLAVELRVAEQRRTGAGVAVLGRLALREQVLIAHPAVPAGDVEGDHDPVAGGDVGDLRSDLLDDAHRLVTEHVAGVEVRPEHRVEMEVGAAETGRGDADDRIRRASRSSGPGRSSTRTSSFPCQVSAFISAFLRLSSPWAYPRACERIRARRFRRNRRAGSPRPARGTARAPRAGPPRDR